MVAGHGRGTWPESEGCVAWDAGSQGRSAAPRRRMPVDEVPVKAPGDRPTVLTDGALQMTGYHDASGVSSIGCPVFISTGTDRRWFEVHASMPQPTGQRASTDLGRINLRMVARSPRHVRASKAHGMPLLAPEMTALTGLSLHKVGAAVGRRRSHRANDGQEPTGEHGDHHGR
jgi:hypothetical protein